MVFIIVSAVLFLDQSSKYIAGRNLALSEPVPVIKNIFYLTLVHNRGAAFGILKNQTLLFIITSLIAIILISSSLRRQRGEGFCLYPLSLALILAGAIGNLIDRLRFGYVVDFFDFRIWPVFNIADSAITVGAVLLAWHLLTCRDTRSDKNKVGV